MAAAVLIMIGAAGCQPDYAASCNLSSFAGWASEFGGRKWVLTEGRWKVAKSFLS